MISDNGKNVIYHEGKHGVDIYRATIPNAVKLINEMLEEAPDLEHALKAYEDSRQASYTGPALRIAENMAKALSSVLHAEEGSNLSVLQGVVYGPPPKDEPDTRPTVVVTTAWKQELILWMFKHDLTEAALKTASAARLNESRPVEELSFLSPLATRLNNGVRFMGRDYYEGAAEARVLLRASWKEDALELNVITRYIRFLNDWAGGRWDVLPIQDVD